VGVNACTDVTGFGLLGHLLGMMKGAKTKAVIHSANVPFFEGILELVIAGIVPGGTKNNYEFTNPFVHYTDDIPHAMKMMLNDAQTSGGLLIALPAEKGQDLIQALLHNGVSTAVTIGEVLVSKKPQIEVV
jgi:selenide,water dikinase